MIIRQRFNLIALLACLIGGIFAIFELRGTEASLAKLLSLFFSGVCGGALLAIFIRGLKK